MHAINCREHVGLQRHRGSREILFEPRHARCPDQEGRDKEPASHEREREFVRRKTRFVRDARVFANCRSDVLALVALAEVGKDGEPRAQGLRAIEILAERTSIASGL
jgi:hypothetical protein